jgi:hypothetical protein
MSPEGWLRMTVWYDSLKEPPKVGSLQETLAFMYVRWVKRAEVQKWVGLYAALGVKERALTTMRDMLAKGAFPYLDTDDSEFREKTKRTLDKWIIGGPVVVGPKARPKYKLRGRRTSGTTPR